MKTVVGNIVYIWVEIFRTCILAEYWEINFGKVCCSICTMFCHTESHINLSVTANAFLINSQLNLAVLQLGVGGSVKHMFLQPQSVEWLAASFAVHSKWNCATMIFYKALRLIIQQHKRLLYFSLQFYLMTWCLPYRKC